LDIFIDNILQIYDFLYEKNNKICLSYWLSLNLKLLKLLKCFKPIDKLIIKFDYLIKKIDEISLIVDKIDSKLEQKLELVNTIYKLKTIYFKDNQVIEKLYQMYVNGQYDNLTVDCIITNIVVNYPDQIEKLFDQIINNDSINNNNLIKSLQYIDSSNFNIFVNKFIHIIKFSDIHTFFSNVVTNSKIVVPVVKMIYKNYKSIDEKLLHEIIQGITINLYNDQSINLMIDLINNHLIQNKNNNYLLNLDHLKTNKKIILRFNF
jgi:hypothetical protein